MARSIEYERVTLPDLPFRVLDRAFFRPQAAKLWEKERARQREVAKGAGTRLADHLKAQWHLEETWIGHSLDALLAGLPSRVLTSSIRALCDGFAISHPALHHIKWRGLRSLVGDPDFVLKGMDATVLGEIKVGAKKTSHRYSLQQHRKFMTLGALCSFLANQTNSVCHLLIVPDTDPRKFCSDFDRWQPERLCHRLKFRDDGKLKAHVSDVVRSEVSRGGINLSRSRIESIENLDLAEIVPTFVYSWKDFAEVVRKELHAVDLNEFITSVDRLESLACGSREQCMREGIANRRLRAGRRLDSSTGGPLD